MAFDLDDVLSYRTPRMVRIRDRKLCIGRIVVIFLIFVYVVVYAVIIQKGYLEREQPVGFVRMSMRSDNASMTTPYCGSQVNAGLKYKSLPCMKWSYFESVFPALEENSLMVTTRYSIRTTTSTVANRDCYWNINDCAPVIDNTTAYYVPGVENYTLLFSHAVYGIENAVHSIEREMSKGYITNENGDVIKDFTAERKSGKNPFPGDLITVKELLEITGVNLDAESGRGSGETNRYGGVIILIFIKYSSSKISLSDLKYTIRVIRIPNIEDKHEQTLYRDIAGLSGPVSQRTVINRHGVRMIVAQSGQVGKFSFQELLKTLVTALALMGVANFLVDQVLLRILPLRKVYHNYKYTTTVDFSDIRRTKGSDVYMANAHGDARGRPFQIEAHDFLYGTLLRGGTTGQPDWNIGEGPEIAYKQCVANAALIPQKVKPQKPEKGSAEHKFGRLGRHGKSDKHNAHTPPGYPHPPHTPPSPPSPPALRRGSTRNNGSRPHYDVSFDVPNPHTQGGGHPGTRSNRGRDRDGHQTYPHAHPPHPYDIQTPPTMYSASVPEPAHLYPQNQRSHM